MCIRDRSQAARDAGISYKAAWQAIETLTSLSGLPLVERSVGGSGGGGARITPQGLQLLAVADELALARAQVLARYAQVKLGEALPHTLGLRTSMRNQLPCVVAGVQPLAQGPMVEVALRTSGGQTLTSRVTRESADLLGLLPGLAVLALCKATAVAVVTLSSDAQPGDPCFLTGVVADLSAGPGPQEVSLSLPGGSLWTGFGTQNAGLAVGDMACARFEPSAVVIGLSG